MQISMLGYEQLDALAGLAAQAPGGILEIGPYIGGSTIALAQSAGKRPFVTIESGGAHNHPTLPTKDILADLRANLERFNVRNVTICKGWYQHEHVRAAALKALGRKIGLLVIDADGDLDHVLEWFRPHMAPGCFLAIDDYLAPGAPEKAAPTKVWVDRHVASGDVVTLEIAGSQEAGTGMWTGRLS